MAASIAARGVAAVLSPVLSAWRRAWHVPHTTAERYAMTDAEFGIRMDAMAEARQAAFGARARAALKRKVLVDDGPGAGTIGGMDAPLFHGLHIGAGLVPILLAAAGVWYVNSEVDGRAHDDRFKWSNKAVMERRVALLEERLQQQRGGEPGPQGPPADGVGDALPAPPASWSDLLLGGRNARVPLLHQPILDQLEAERRRLHQARAPSTLTQEDGGGGSGGMTLSSRLDRLEAQVQALVEQAQGAGPAPSSHLHVPGTPATPMPSPADTNPAHA